MIGKILGLDPVAVYAAFVATGALFLEVRRWSESGARLRLSVMPNAVFAGEPKSPDRNVYLALNVTNVGDQPTSLTHMALYQFDSKLSKLRNRSSFSAIVPRPLMGTAPAFPYLLGPGTVWTGMMKISGDDELTGRLNSGKLFVGVYASHSKRAILIRVKPQE